MPLRHPKGDGECGAGLKLDRDTLDAAKQLQGTKVQSKASSR